MFTRFVMIAVIATTLLIQGTWARADFHLAAASFLGGSGDDDVVVGCAIQSDGKIVLAANLSPGALPQLKEEIAETAGFLMWLSPDGQKLLVVKRMPATITDLSLDAKDRLHVGLGDAGLTVLEPNAGGVVEPRSIEGGCLRIDAAPDGHFVALSGAKQIRAYAPSGEELSVTAGRDFCNDVCIDSATRTVVFIGFRNARAFEGKGRYPVQISYVQGNGYDGNQKWVNYDWSTDMESDRFLNKPTNNMADTRAYRCEIGRDGKLYVGFEAAGGNHIFRYSPKDIMQKVAIVGGGQHHSFHASRAEHKLVFCRFDPATGDYLTGQQFCGRLSSGRANGVRMKQGNLAADETGRPYLTGTAGMHIPLTFDPLPEIDKGGPYLLVMSREFDDRQFVTRLIDNGNGACVDSRRIGDRQITVYAGGGVPAGMHTEKPLQKTCRGEKDAFFVVVHESG